MKTCTGCQESKSLTEFSKSVRHPSGLNPRCKVCNSVYRKSRTSQEREYRRTHRSNNPQKYKDAARRKHLRACYGLSVEEYEEIWQRQMGLCPICTNDLTATRPVVDHDHRCCPSAKTCGKCVRGILCSTCNAGIGLLLDNYKTVLRAAEYLRVPDEE